GIGGIIHRSSDTGRTLFIEPSEAVELNNRLIELRRDEEKEIGRILWQLGHLIHLNQKEILASLEAAALIDLNIAKARYADAYDMSVPEVSANQSLRLTQARHPLLLAMRKNSADRADAATDPVVPIDVRLGDDFDMLVVTGPNTGGKTAALKTIGLL